MRVLLPQSMTLFSYMAGRYAVQIALTFVILTAFLYFLDITELARRLGQKDADYPIWQLMGISFLKLPSQISVVLPFSILFGSMMCFFFWCKSHEFTIARATGQSIWSALYPVFVVAFCIGVIEISLINPIAATTAKQYDRQMEQIFGQKPNSSISISTNGLWFKDSSAGNNLIINGAQLDVEKATIYNPVVYQVQTDGLMQWRLTADQMRLTDNGWILTDVTRTYPQGQSDILGDVLLPTSLSASDILSSRQSAHTIPVYQLPYFINTQKLAGFPVTEHQVFLHQLIATPLEFIGIVMIAAALTLSHFSRMIKTKLFVYGVAVGFGFYFLSDLIYLLGSSSRIPYLFAGYGPAIILCAVGGFFVARIDE